MSHHAVVRARVRAVFRVHRVVTSVQLERWGLLGAADRMALPRVTLDVRTQVTQPTSQRTLTFVGMDERWLTQPPRELLHHALLAEAACQVTSLVEPGYTWHYLDLRGREVGVRPDAEVQWAGRSRDEDVAVEVDTGYASARRRQKLVGAAALGYRRIVWATSIQGRVARIVAEAEALARLGELPGLVGVSATYVNVHAPRPYERSARIRKVPVAHWWAEGRVMSDGSG